MRALRPALWLLLFVAGCVAVARTEGLPPRPAVVSTSGGAPIAPAGPIQATSDRIPIEPTNAVRGAPNAPVTVVAFLDLECPYCATAEQTLQQLRQRYGDQLRIVFKHFPLVEIHRQALPAARVAQAVYAVGGAPAFFRFLAAAYENQASLSDQSLRQWAERSGVPRASLDAALNDPAIDKAVQADVALAKRLGVTGTPEFRINGAELGGAQPIEEFTKIIDAELVTTRQLLREGTAPSDVYRVRVAGQTVVKPVEVVEPPDTKIYRLPVAGSPISGPADALVTIVEFGDFECPFCKRVQATLAELRKRYPGQIRIVFKNNPLSFHEHAMPAAQLALEARAQRGDAGFFEVADALFAIDSMNDPDLLVIAKNAHLDLGRVRQALHKKTDPSIDRDQMLALDVDAPGTPQFFVNGRRVGGAQPLEVFINAVEPGLARAKELVASGVAPNKVYDKILEGAEGPPEPEKKTAPPVTAQNPTRGPVNAPIVIHEFADFQCPFCKRVEPAIRDLDRAYPGKIRWVWHNMPLPFHQNAGPAANAAMEAFAQRGAGGFWAMHDLLYEHQSQDDGLARAGLEECAHKLGLDSKRFTAALDGSTHRTQIDADQALAQSAGITGTPSFIINGYFVSGAQPFPMFRRVVQRALENLKKPAPSAPKPPAEPAH